MAVRSQTYSRRSITIALVLLGVLLLACSSSDDPSPTTEPQAPQAPETTVPATDQTADVAQAEDWVRQFDALLSSGRPEEAAALFSPDWRKLGIQMTEGGWGVIPVGETGDAFGEPADLVAGLEFIVALMDLDIADCTGAAQGPSRVVVPCIATVSGPYPEAMGLPPFDLPVLFIADQRGLVEYGTDFAAADTGSFVADEATEQYFAEYSRLALYGASDADFTALHTRGIGRPVISADSAAAHIELAREWAAAGKP